MIEVEYLPSCLLIQIVQKIVRHRMKKACNYDKIILITSMNTHVWQLCKKSTASFNFRTIFVPIMKKIMMPTIV